MSGIALPFLNSCIAAKRIPRWQRRHDSVNSVHSLKRRLSGERQPLSFAALHPPPNQVWSVAAVLLIVRRGYEETLGRLTRTTVGKLQLNFNLSADRLYHTLTCDAEEAQRVFDTGTPYWSIRLKTL